MSDFEEGWIAVKERPTRCRLLVNDMPQPTTSDALIIGDEPSPKTPTHLVRHISRYSGCTSRFSKS